MFGSWPIATNSPSAVSSHVSSVCVSRRRDAGHLHVAEHLVDRRVRDPLDLLVRTGAVEHDLRRAEVVAAVHDRHLGRELRQEESLLHRGVAAADHDHLAVAVERRVADGAVGHALALEALLRRQAELASRRAGRDDHGLGRGTRRRRRRPGTAAPRSRRASRRRSGTRRRSARPARGTPASAPGPRMPSVKPG